MVQLHDLTTLPQEKSWQAAPAETPEPHRVVLYLGCNVLRNSHMIRTVTDIFQLLGEDYIAVGGPAYCCGIVQHREGDVEISQSMGQRTVSYLERFQPERVVMWCPSCVFYYDEVFELPTPFQSQHVTEYLVDNLHKLELAGRSPQRVALHYHANRPQRLREAEAARTLLSAVPGLEYIEIGSDADFGTICSPQQGIGEDWRRRVDRQLRQAQEAEVDTFATLYHGCQRLICVNEERYPFRISHYLDLVARSLGIEHEDTFKKYRLWRDPDRVLSEMAPCMEASAVPIEQAQQVVARNFPSH
ncbi:MAG: heterodisulfide reductase-related iron-sulfur binding cluster [Dehalococcoidia bacterium]